MRGRIRRRIALADGGDEALAELTMPGSKHRRRRRAGTAEDRHDGSWTMQDEGEGVTVRRDGVAHAAVRGDELHVGDRRYRLELYAAGPRSASATTADGSPVLTVRADGGRRRPWAAIRRPGAPPLPLPGVLAVAYTLLADEADTEGWSVFDIVCGLLTPAV